MMSSFLLFLLLFPPLPSSGKQHSDMESAAAPLIRRCSPGKSKVCDIRVSEGISCDSNGRVIDMSLRSLNLSCNISSVLSEHRSLIRLDLSNNSFTGASIRPGLTSLSSLKYLNLSRNAFGGSISMSLPSSLNKLEFLDLSYNRFNGSIPASFIGNLTSLSLFNASHNHLLGEIPSTLGNCAQLEFLDLRNNSFRGRIPSNLSTLQSLREIDLSNNNLSGPIPSFFGSFTNLTLLNLSFNHFEGEVPTNGPIFTDGSRNFLVEGNEYLCRANDSVLRDLKLCNQSTQIGRKASGGFSKYRLAVIVAVPVIIIILICLSIFLCVNKSKLFRYTNSGGPLISEASKRNAPPAVLTYADLQEATKEFTSDNLIGSGALGSVYRGVLKSPKEEIVVKVFSKQVHGDPNSFVVACREMRNIRHRNLVNILTCFASEGEGKDPIRAVVHQLMPNGNLEMWLHHEVVSPALPFRKWNLNLYQRLNIAIDVASALLHLHTGRTPIVLCNLKPSNILLEEEMTAVVADVGMDRFFPLDLIVDNSTGYAAPESRSGRPVIPGWDVYSFGVILLEMITGRRPTNEAFGEDMDLQRYVLQRFHIDLKEIVDPLLLSEETGGQLTERTERCIESILSVALTCSRRLPDDRGDIGTALQDLRRAKQAFLLVQTHSSTKQRLLDHSNSDHPMLGDVA